MKSILHINSLDVVNGTLIDSLEYWLYLFDLGEPVHYMTNASFQFIDEVLRSRYRNISDDAFRYITSVDLDRLTKVLMFGATFIKLADQLPQIPMRCIHSYASASRNLSHPVFLEGYEKKMYLSKLTNGPSIARKYLHRSSFTLTEESPTVLFLDKETQPVLVYVSPQFKEFASKRYASRPNIQFVFGGILPNFFTQFDQLVYLYERPDFSPRLFIECAFLGKGVSYAGEMVEGDGSTKRFRDALSGSLSQYQLTPEDEAVDWLMN